MGTNRKAGKSPLRMCYRWAVPGGGAMMHLFWFLSGQDSGKSMCGRVVFDAANPIKDALFVPVCARCRELGAGHPLPRGML